MVIVDQVHVVSVTFAGTTRRIASANLNGHLDTLESLRRRVGMSVRKTESEAVMAAFDLAFAACEASRGEIARGSADFTDGSIAVVRSISA